MQKVQKEYVKKYIHDKPYFSDSNVLFKLAVALQVSLQMLIFDTIYKFAFDQKIFLSKTETRTP